MIRNRAAYDACIPVVTVAFDQKRFDEGRSWNERFNAYRNALIADGYDWQTATDATYQKFVIQDHRTAEDQLTAGANE